jgi:hypothetical protein
MVMNFSGSEDEFKPQCHKKKKERKKKWEHTLFFLVVLGFWTHSFTLARQVLLLLEPQPPPFFTLDIFKIGSQELFAGAGFEP